MLRRVLIANRGEIALRVLRACRELGIETVAVYSQADADALHVQLAGQAVCIGPARAADSYLNQDALLTVAKATGCDGVHPGYGFLSENADFADACAAAGLTFIGPSWKIIRELGDKINTKRLARSLGVPTVPGSDRPIYDEMEAERIARNHLEYYLDGRCALIYLTRDEIRQSGVDPADLEELTSLPISIEGVKVGLTLRQQPGGSYRISVRTAKGVDACAIARRLGGGGHTRAAGCELLGDLENAKNAILAEVEAELDAPQEEA